MAAMAEDTKSEVVSTKGQRQSFEENSSITEGTKGKVDNSTTDIDMSESVGDQKYPEDADDAEKHANVAASPSDDENIVFWDGDDDPANPYNWPSWLKVLNCVLVSSLTFLTPLGSCMPSLGTCWKMNTS